MNPTDRSFKHIKRYYADKLALCLLIVFGASIFTLLLSISQNIKETILEQKYIERSDYQQKEEVIFSVEGGVTEKELSITVDKQELTEQEILELFQKAEDQLPKTILKHNKSIQEIRSDMNLTDYIEGFPIVIDWNTDNFDVLASDGEVDNTELDASGVLVNLTANLTYQEYSQEVSFQVKVLPPILTDEEQLTKGIMEQIKSLNEKTITSKFLELPTVINGKAITWTEKKSKTAGYILVFGVFVAVMVFYSKDEELQKSIKKRNRELLSDYPDIVSKLTLLLGAGLTIKGAWQKIALDYREKKEADSKYFRYAYEEMLITYYEITGGISEQKAYEDFGKRCKNERYLKLSALITQNLRKGSRGLSQILQRESIDAFEDRKAYAKIIGEEAGTKLMVPMFLDLIVVLIIIIIPACMSFQM